MALILISLNPMLFLLVTSTQKSIYLIDTFTLLFTNIFSHYLMLLLLYYTPCSFKCFFTSNPNSPHIVPNPIFHLFLPINLQNYEIDFLPYFILPLPFLPLLIMLIIYTMTLQILTVLVHYKSMSLVESTYLLNKYSFDPPTCS